MLVPWSLMLFAVLMLWTKKVVAVHSLPPSQVTALQNFYESTSGREWTWQLPYSLYGEPWDFTTADVNPCDSWQGVTCSSSCGLNPCTVTGLSLSAHNLDGTLPSSLFNLINLTSLILSENSISGTVPTTFGSWTQLQVLDLSTNQLTGSMPKELGYLIQLNILSLYENSLSGRIPEDFGGLSNLEQLNIYSNRLSGIIPSQLSDMTHLRYLRANNNKLYGFIPEYLGELVHLTELALFSNRLSGSLPAELGSLTQLTYFGASQNSFTGSIPREFGGLVNCVYLFLYDNLLSGSLPDELGNLAALEVLELNINDFTGTIPETIGNLRNLNSLLLNSNSFSGALPSSLSNLTSVITLSLQSNQLTGTIPHALGHMTSLENMFLDRNALTGTISSSFGALTNLANLEINNNILSGTLPDSFGNLLNMVSCFLDYNVLSGSLPSFFGQLEKLETLTLTLNRFNGTIPDSFGQLINLQIFQAELNDLSGTLPPSLVNLYNISQLFLSNNKFTGTIPAFVGSNLSALTTLELDYNLFTGTIPPELGQLTQLTYLTLEENYLTGSFPPELCNLYRLQSISVTANMLSGSLSADIGKLQSLTVLSLASNSLTGSLPSTIGHMTHMEDLDMFSNFFNGSIPTEIGELTHLQSLTLYASQMTGSIPSSLVTLSNMAVLDMNTNFLSGVLPEDIGSNRNGISVLILYDNYIQGSLPPSLSGLTALTSLYLNDNLLTGTLPAGLGDLSLMITMILSDNFCNGTIPATLGNLLVMTELELSGNLLTGKIPPEVTSNYALINLAIAENFLTGTLPTDYGYNLFSFIVSNNMLTGSIPAGLSKSHSSIGFLYLYENYFTGTISPDFFTLTYLQHFEVYDNLLTGGLPDTGSPSQFLTVLAVFGNRLNGTIPAFLFQAQNNSEILDLSLNLFTGVIPANPYFATELLLLNGNFLTGSLPEVNTTYETSPLHRVLSTALLVAINVSANLLTGSIPSGLSLLTSLSAFTASNNLLSGPLANRFNTQRNLGALNVANNVLTGTLGNLLTSNPSAYTITVSINNNYLSGSLPTALFQPGHISSFIASLNCFTGSLPESLCDNEQLIELLLDGLHASVACTHRLFEGYANSAYVSDGSMEGTLPACLFDLQHLSILHVSGNALTGSLPAALSLHNTSFTSVILSHNALTGSIPPGLMARELVTLDLSFNRLQGTIPATNATYSDSNYSLVLQVNRLSGEIPASLVHASNIDILDGNVFACTGPFSNTLIHPPQRDPVVSSYACGSVSTNIALMITAIFLSSLCLVMVLCGVVWNAKQWFLEQLRQLYRHYTQLLVSINHPYQHRNQFPALTAFVNISHRLLRADLLVVNLLLLCLAIPLYATLNHFYGTYAYAYVWVVSVAHLQGVTPGLLLLGFWCFLWVALEIRLQHLQQDTGLVEESHNGIFVHESSAMHESDPSSGGNTRLARLPIIPHTSTMTTATSAAVDSSATVVENPMLTLPGTQEQRMQLLHQSDSSPVVAQMLFHIVFILCNAFVALTVNGAYVYAVSQHDSATHLSFLSLSISLFKILWTHYIVNEGFGQWAGRACGLHLHRSCQIAVSLFNNIIAPFLAEGLVSTNCFRYALSSAPAIDSTIPASTCLLLATPIDLGITSYTYKLIYCQPSDTVPSNYTIVGTIANGVAIATSYTPGFLYNYACSASLLQAFAYVFVYRYLLSGIVWPVLLVCIKYLQESCVNDGDHTSIAQRSDDIAGVDGGGGVHASSRRVPHQGWWKSSVCRMCTMVLPISWHPLSTAVLVSCVDVDGDVETATTTTSKDTGTDDTIDATLNAMHATGSGGDPLTTPPGRVRTPPRRLQINQGALRYNIRLLRRLLRHHLQEATTHTTDANAPDTSTGGKSDANTTATNHQNTTNTASTDTTPTDTTRTNAGTIATMRIENTNADATVNANENMTSSPFPSYVYTPLSTSSSRQMYLRLVTDAAVFCAFGLCFPPLGFLLLFSAAVEVVGEVVALGRLVGQCETSSRWIDVCDGHQSGDPDDHDRTNHLPVDVSLVRLLREHHYLLCTFVSHLDAQFHHTFYAVSPSSWTPSNINTAANTTATTCIADSADSSVDTNPHSSTANTATCIDTTNTGTTTTTVGGNHGRVQKTRWTLHTALLSVTSSHLSTVRAVYLLGLCSMGFVVFDTLEGGRTGEGGQGSAMVVVLIMCLLVCGSVVAVVLYACMVASRSRLSGNSPENNSAGEVEEGSGQGRDPAPPRPPPLSSSSFSTSFFAPWVSSSHTTVSSRRVFSSDNKPSVELRDT